MKIHKDYRRGNIPYMNIQKSWEYGNEAVSCLVMAGYRLKTGEIMELKINNYNFIRASFETKKGRWNQSLYNRCAINAYEIEVLTEIINS